jgi:hypothetical protein
MSEVKPARLEETESNKVSFRFYVGLFLVSFALLYLEILINRILSYVLWAFGINAAGSVIGAILCVFIAMELNFTSVLICAASLYLAAGLIIKVFPSADYPAAEPAAGTASQGSQ